MIKDGKALELFVRQIEEEAAAPGATIEPRVRAYSDDGNQIAEFDLVVTGKFGTTNVRWLLECRDRPSEGPAPNAWIEQLMGRKTAHQFDRVTAVSTTGFARGCDDLANRFGIELRSVKNVDPSDFSDWFALKAIEQIRQIAELVHCAVEFAIEPTADQNAEIETLLAVGANAMQLWSEKNQEYATASRAFLALVRKENSWDGLAVGERKEVAFVAEYPGDDRFELQLTSARVPISRIHFIGRVWVEHSYIPVAAAEQYATDGGAGEVIAQRLQFHVPIDDKKFAVEFIRLPDGRQQVQMRLIG